MPSPWQHSLCAPAENPAFCWAPGLRRAGVLGADPWERCWGWGVGKAPRPVERADLMHKEVRGGWRDTGKEEQSDLARNPGAHWGLHPLGGEVPLQLPRWQGAPPVTVCMGGRVGGGSGTQAVR